MRLVEWQLQLENYLLGSNPQASAALQGSLLSSPTLSAQQGLAIYHHAYRARLLEALREDYPAVHYWLGDDEFATLAQAFCAAQPSQHFSLRWFGAGFAGFISASLDPQDSPPLAELARLEWAFGLAFDAAAGTPLSLAQMASLPAADWPGLQVQLLAHVQLVTLEYNSLALWQAAKAQADFPPSVRLAQDQTCLIWRHGLVSNYRSLSAAEALALQGMAMAGWSFAELCEQLAEHGEQAPALAAGWLKQWLSEGLLQRG